METRVSENPSERHGDNLYPMRFSAQFGSHELSLDVPSGIWNPTPHGIHLGNVLSHLDFRGEHVLELGCGCGIHTIIIARQGAAKMTVTEIDQAALDNTIHNLDKHHVEIPIDSRVCDWTQVGEADFDALVANPPFMRSGKAYRRYFIDTLILEAHKLVRPGGRMIFVQSSMADIPRSIALMEQNGMAVEVLGESDGPFRSYYFEDAAFMREIAAIPAAYTLRDGLHFERLIVLQGQIPG